MEPVPWQVAYGHWLGWTAGLVLVILGCAVFWLWLRWVALRRGRVVLAKLGPSGSKFTQGPVVLCGKLEVPGAPVPALDGSGAAAACTVEASSETLRFARHRTGSRRCFRAPSLHILTTDGSVTLRGGVLVTHGSRESFPGRLTALDDEDRERLTSAPDDVVSFGAADWPKALRIPGMIRTVRHGDEVVVRGIVQRNLGDGGPGASYRPMESVFELVAPEGEDAIEVAATAPAVIAFGKAALLGRGLTVGVVLSLAVGVILGGSALRVDDFATAALFPPERAWAIGELAREAASGGPSEVKLATLLAYEEYAPDCRRTGEAFFAHGRFKQSGEVLEGCQEGDAKTLAVAAYRMEGALDQACRTLEAQGGNDGADDARLFVLGGCMKSAAAALRRDAARKGQDADRAQTLQCLADAIDAQGGDAEAGKRLAAQGGEACRLAHADLLQGEERAKALAYLADAPASERAKHRHQLLREVLASSVGGRIGLAPLPHLPTAPEFLVDPSSSWAGRAHGLEHEALKTLALVKAPTVEQRSLRRTLAIREAAFETSAGNEEDAARLLDVAKADVAALPQSSGDSNTPYEAWIERLKAEAQIATLRSVGLLLKGDVDGAASVLAAWRDLTPSHFLGDLAPGEALPEALNTIRSEVVRPIDDASALVATARGKTTKGKSLGPNIAIELLAASSDDVSLDGLNTAEGSSLLPVLRRRSTIALPLLVVVGRRVETGAGVLDWLRYEARAPNPNPITSMWQATLASHGARMLNAPALAEQQVQAAQAYRTALLQRQAALFFALLPAE